MKRILFSILVLIATYSTCWAIPIEINYYFSGVIEQNQTCTMFGLADTFSGQASYFYDEDSNGPAANPNRPFFFGHEIELSYLITIGDWNIRNEFNENHPNYNSYASFDKIITFVDEVPIQSGIDELYFLDMVTVSPNDNDVWFSGINPNQLPSELRSIHGTITDLTVTTNPVPEPASIILLCFGISAYLARQKILGFF